MKRNPEDPKAPQFFVKIDRTQTSQITRHRKSGEKWDGDDDIESHEINGFEVVEEKQSWDFVLPYDPTGKTMYLICAFYDTGDSFHRSENHLELVSLQEHLEDAQVIMRFLVEDYKKFQEHDKYDYKPSKVHLPVSDKTEELYTGTWKGYFKHLREFRIESLGAGNTLSFIKESDCVALHRGLWPGKRQGENLFGKKRFPDWLTYLLG